MEKKIRLQVFLSRCGVSSRRKAADLIKAGKIGVNSEIIRSPAYSVNPDKDAVTFRGKKLFLKEKLYILLNKPAGVTTTKKDRFAKKKVIDLLPRRYRHLHPVGRLDKETSGLLLLTNDGELTLRLTHPRFETEKTYQLVIDKALRVQDAERLKKGVLLKDGPTSPAKVKVLGAKKLEITIQEGRKRQVRRMLAELGYQVAELTRTRECFLTLGNLPPGRWRMLSPEEIKRLHQKLRLKN